MAPPALPSAASPHAATLLPSRSISASTAASAEARRRRVFASPERSPSASMVRPIARLKSCGVREIINTAVDECCPSERSRLSSRAAAASGTVTMASPRTKPHSASSASISAMGTPAAAAASAVLAVSRQHPASVASSRVLTASVVVVGPVKSPSSAVASPPRVAAAASASCCTSSLLSRSISARLVDSSRVRGAEGRRVGALGAGAAAPPSNFVKYLMPHARHATSSK